jgi:hypothetical protein
MSNLFKHAERELDLIGLTEENEYDGMMRKHILHMIKEFSDEGHSGFSASYAISLLSRLLDYKPLSPLTGEDSEWTQVADGSSGMKYQNNRKSSVFKDADGSCYDIDGKVFWEWYKNGSGEAVRSYYSCRESQVPVTFPYVVPDKPIYEYRQSNADPKTPPQTEEGFI